MRFRRVAKLFSQHKWRLALVMIVIAMSSLVALGLPLFIKTIVDNALPHGNRKLLVLCVIGMLAVAITNGLLSIGQAWLTTSVGQTIMNDLRTKVFRHLQSQSMSFFTRTRGGEIQSRLTNDIAGLQSVITNTATQVATSLTTTIATVSAMLVLSWRLTLLTAVVVPPALWLTRAVAKTRRTIVTERQRTMADLTSQVEEALSVSGAQLTKTLGIGETRGENFERTSESLAGLEIQSKMAGRGRMAAMNIAFAAIPAGVYVAAGYPEYAGDVSIGTLIAFTTLQAAVFKPLVDLLNLGADWVASMALLSRIFGYLDLPVEVVPPTHPTPFPRQLVRGHVTFDTVSYRYPDGESDVLRDIRITIPPGGSAAFVGETGSGKSTLGSLLVRLADPTRGRVLIDGVDLRAIAAEDLAGAVGIVSQDTYLTHASIRENLLVASPRATEERIWQVLRAAQIADYVASLPDGLDTIVGSRGHRFSGGEKQRLAIARTLLRDPKILVLDEATSALDNETEQELQVAIDELSRGRTTLTIAHRLSTVRNVDVVYVLDAGVVVEAGSFDQLMARDGAFARLARKTEVTASPIGAYEEWDDALVQTARRITL